jgi:hypothetical protein
MSMYSFTKTLSDVCITVRPNRVVEWGPGLSTQLIHTLCPLSQHVAIEHSPKYSKIAADAYPFVELRQFGIDSPKSAYASCVMRDAPYDIAFIDGRRRVECVLCAFVNNPDIIIILHDANRWQYMLPLRHIIDPIPEFNSDKTTLVFKRKGIL